MKVCKNCGTNLPDEVSFCSNCGASAPAAQPSYNRLEAKGPISVGGWIGRSLIPMIPLVGTIVWLIMLFVWSGDTRKEDTFRNWAKAQLIVTAIVVVLVILVGIVFGATAVDLMESL